MKCLGFHSIWRRNLRNLRCLRLGLFHAPLAFPIIRGLQVNPLGSNPITVPSMTSLVKYSLLLLLKEKMERAPPYIILVKSLESVAFRRLLQDNKNITTLTQRWKIYFAGTWIHVQLLSKMGQGGDLPWAPTAAWGPTPPAAKLRLQTVLEQIPHYIYIQSTVNGTYSQH